MRRNHTYKLDTLVIGTDLSALIYSYLNNHTFVFERVDSPTQFEFLPVDFPTHLFYHTSNSRQIKSLDGMIQLGVPKIELWNRLLFTMSASGLLPFGTKETTVRHRDNLVSIKTKSRNYQYEVDDVQKIKNSYHKVKVYDWISVRSCGPIDIEYLNTGDDFITELFFYPSERNGAHKTVLDAMAISQLTPTQLQSFDYGETMSRLKIRSLLKNMGIKGPRNGKNPTYPRSPEKYKYAPIKLEHNYREIRKNKVNNSEQEIVQQYLNEKKQLPEDSYLHRFNRRISEERLR